AVTNPSTRPALRPASRNWKAAGKRCCTGLAGLRTMTWRSLRNSGRPERLTQTTSKSKPANGRRIRMEIPQFLGGDYIESGFGRLGVDGEKTGECGICNRQFGRSAVGQLNGVLVHA